MVNKKEEWGVRREEREMFGGKKVEIWTEPAKGIKNQKIKKLKIKIHSGLARYLNSSPKIGEVPHRGGEVWKGIKN